MNVASKGKVPILLADVMGGGGELRYEQKHGYRKLLQLNKLPIKLYEEAVKRLDDHVAPTSDTAPLGRRAANENSTALKTRRCRTWRLRVSPS